MMKTSAFLTPTPGTPRPRRPTAPGAAAARWSASRPPPRRPTSCKRPARTGSLRRLRGRDAGCTLAEPDHNPFARLRLPAFGTDSDASVQARLRREVDLLRAADPVDDPDLPVRRGDERLLAPAVEGHAD